MGYISVILGLYWDNGTENGSFCQQALSIPVNSNGPYILWQTLGAPKLPSELSLNWKVKVGLGMANEGGTWNCSRGGW